MGWMICAGNCCNCGNIFDFNPDRVPSVRGHYEGNMFVLDPCGSREPICRSCFDAGNRLRVAKGLPPFDLPSGAYDPEEAA